MSLPRVIAQPKGRESAVNSTSANLGVGAVFTGGWEDVLDYGGMVIAALSSHDSATDGLCIDWSADGITKTQDDAFTVLAGAGKVFTFTPPNRYFRLVYTNGGTLTTNLSIQTILKPFGWKSSSHRIQDDIVDEDDATLVKSVLTARKPDGTFTNIGATEEGNLKVSLEVDAASEHKFGFQDAIGKVTRQVVWDKNAAYPAWPGDGVLTVESSVAGDTSIGITCVGLSAAGEEISETITTNAADGTTPEAGGTTFAFGTYRAWVSAGSAPAGFISIKRGGAEVMRIQVGFGQTQMCRWIVPTIVDGVTYSGCYLKELTANVGASDKCNLYLVAQTPTDVMPRVKRYFGNVQGPIEETFTNGGTIAGIFFPAGTILAIEGLALNTSAEVSASFLAGMEL